MAITTRKAAPATTLAPKWNEERRQAFLDTLSESSNVAAAERAAGMAPCSAYRERRKNADFRAAWDEALCEGYARLELVLLERALSGVVARTTKTPKREVKEQFSDRLGMALLAAHRQAVSTMRGQRPVADGESSVQWLTRKLADMKKKMGDAA